MSNLFLRNDGIFASPSSSTSTSTSGTSQSTGLYVIGGLTVNPTTSAVASIQVNATSNSTQQGFFISQAGSTSGNQNSSVYFNEINITGDQSNLGSLGVSADALYIGYDFGGSNTSGARQALEVAATLTSQTSTANTNRNYTATAFFVNAGSGDGGTTSAQLGNFTGIYGGVRAQNGATNLSGIAGQEIDVVGNAGSSFASAIGLLLVRWGAVQAAGTDAAVIIDSAGGGSVSWKQGLYFINNGGATPITTSGTVIGTDGSVNSVGSILEFQNYTATNYLIHMNNFQVTGPGIVVSYGSQYVPTAIANLPSSPSTGMVAAVNNALNPTMGTTLSSGGSAYALLTYGTAGWRVIGT